VLLVLYDHETYVDELFITSLSLYTPCFVSIVAVQSLLLTAFFFSLTIEKILLRAMVLQVVSIVHVRVEHTLK